MPSKPYNNESSLDIFPPKKAGGWVHCGAKKNIHYPH